MRARSRVCSMAILPGRCFRKANPLAAYFLGGGKSCSPLSSFTTVIAFTGQERAAARMVASGAPLGFTTSDFSSASNWNTAGAVSTQSPLLMQRVLFTVTLRLAIASPCFDRLFDSLELRVGGRQANRPRTPIETCGAGVDTFRRGC